MATKQEERPPLFETDDRYSPRLSPALAEEIGLNESILLLQIEFLIRISNHEINGRRWTYQSVRDLQVFFPFWSLMTINRTIRSLQKKGLVTVENYNKAKYDRTRWFALDFEKLSRLKSVKMLYQNDTRSSQNDTTIPDSSAEASTESSSYSRDDDDEFSSIRNSNNDNVVDDTASPYGLKEESTHEDNDLQFDLDGVDKWLYDAAHGFGTNGSTPTCFQNTLQRDKYRKLAGKLGERTPEAFTLAHESPDPPTTLGGLISYAATVAERGFYGDNDSGQGATRIPFHVEMGLPEPADTLESNIQLNMGTDGVMTYARSGGVKMMPMRDMEDIPYDEFVKHYVAYVRKHNVDIERAKKIRKRDILVVT